MTFVLLVYDVKKYHLVDVQVAYVALSQCSCCLILTRYPAPRGTVSTAQTPGSKEEKEKVRRGRGRRSGA